MHLGIILASAQDQDLSYSSVLHQLGGQSSYVASVHLPLPYL